MQLLQRPLLKMLTWRRWVVLVALLVSAHATLINGGCCRLSVCIEIQCNAKAHRACNAAVATGPPCLVCLVVVGCAAPGCQLAELQGAVLQTLHGKSSGLTSMPFPVCVVSSCLQLEAQQLLLLVMVLVLHCLVAAHQGWQTCARHRPLWFSNWLSWHPCLQILRQHSLNCTKTRWWQRMITCGMRCVTSCGRWSLSTYHVRCVLTVRSVFVQQCVVVHVVLTVFAAAFRSQMAGTQCTSISVWLARWSPLYQGADITGDNPSNY
jgi:hypothetical protein